MIRARLVAPSRPPSRLLAQPNGRDAPSPDHRILSTAQPQPRHDPNQRYQVVRRLDAGGMAEIFLARSLAIQGMERTVAIKRVLPSLTKNRKFTEMFLDEARLSMGLNHANIVTVTDVSESGGTYFIVMEYVDGYNVRHIFQRASERGFRIPVSTACYLMMEVCKGLEHAHTKKDAGGKHLRIVHRDLSPPNILVSRAGEVKITDFGLAKATSQLTRTDPGVVKGKYSYLSPEVTEGKPADHRADIFAAGIVLWELLANRRLFYGKNETETVELVRAADVPPLSRFNPEVKPELQQVLQRALARDPKKRYTSAREFGEALADLLARNSLRATSFDLAQMLERLFGPDGDASGASSDAAKRQKLIATMIEDEVQNLSMAGHSSAARNLVGREPIDPARLALGALNAPRFDLGPTLGTGAAPRALVKARQVPPPSLAAFKEVQDIESMTKLLEGSAVTALAGASVPEESAPTKRGVPGWAIGAIVVVVAGIAAAVAMSL